MSKDQWRCDLNTTDEAIVPGISDEEAETFNDKDEEKGRQREALSDSTRGWKKLRGGPINQNSKVDRGETAHDPIDREEWNPNLNQNQMDIGPIYSIKSLDEVQFKYEGTDVFSFDRVENLLHNANWLSDLATFQEAKFFWWDTQVQKGF